MGKLPRKHKPTVASYFQSESQRKKTSKLAFIYGSKKLVALLSALLIISAISGIVIVQKQKDSKAATTRTNVSFTQASPQVDPGRWQPFENVPGAANGVFNKSTLTMGFSSSYRYTQGYTLCYIMYPEGSASHPGLTYESVVINYTSTERGSTQVSIRKLGTVLSTSVAAEHGGGTPTPRTISANLGGVKPGEQVLFCIEKVAANSNLFVAPVNVQINSYSFTGAYNQFTPDPQPIPAPAPAPAPTAAPSAGNQGNANAPCTSLNTLRSPVPASSARQNGTTDNTGGKLMNSNGDYIECYMKINASENAGKYVLAYSGDAPSGNVQIDLSMAKSSTNVKRSTTYQDKGAGLTGRMPGNEAFDLGKDETVVVRATLNTANGRTGGFVIRELKLVNVPQTTSAPAPAPSTTPTPPAAPACNSSQTLPSGAVEAQGTNVPLSTGGGVAISNAGNNATGCNAVGLAKDKFVQHTFNTDSNPASDYAMIVRAKGKMKVSIILPGTTQGRDAVVDFGSDFKTVNVLGSYSGVAGISGSLIQNVGSNKNVLIRLSNSDGLSGVLVDWVELRKSTQTPAPVSPQPPTPGTPVATPVPGLISSQNCSVSSGQGIFSPVKATDSFKGAGARNITDAGRQVVHLKNAGDYIECLIKLPEGAQAGGYVLAYSGKAVLNNGQSIFGTGSTGGDFNGTVLELSMAGGGKGVQRATTSLGSDYLANYVNDPSNKSRMPIIRSGDSKTTRVMNPGEKVVARITLRKPTVNYGQVYLENLQLFRDPCTAADGSITEGLEVSPGVKCSAPKPQTEDNQAGNPGSGGQSQAQPTTPSPEKCPANPSQNVQTAKASELRRSGGINSLINDSTRGKETIALLATTGAYAECIFTAPASGWYTAGTVARSQDIPGISQTAEATISIAGGKTSLDGPFTLASEKQSTLKNEQYGTLQIKQNQNIRYFTAGSKATVRVTFNNDNRRTATEERPGGDRNLLVESLYISQVSQLETTRGNANLQDGSLTNACSTENTRIEAENGKVKGTGERITVAGASPNGSAIKLTTKDSSVECEILVSQSIEGSYLLGARLKGDKAALAIGSVTAKLSMIVNGKEYTDNVTVNNGQLEFERMQGGTGRTADIKAGQKIVIKVSAINANNGVASKHLIVDTLELRKVAVASAPTLAPTNQTREIANELLITEGQVGAQESINLSTGAYAGTVQAERARFRGTVFKDTDASPEREVVRLWSGKDFVEYEFDFPQTDFYAIGFSGKSESYKGAANAKVLIDRKELEGGGDVQLTDRYVYRESEQRQLVRKGKHTVRIEYTNDKIELTNNQYDQSRDRNMLVDYLRIRGSTVSERQNNLVISADTTTASSQSLLQVENGSQCGFHVTVFAILSRPDRNTSCLDLLVNDQDAEGNRAVLLRRTNDFVKSRLAIDKNSRYEVSVRLKSQDFRGIGATAEIFSNGRRVSGPRIVAPSSENYERFTFVVDYGDVSAAEINIVFKNDNCGDQNNACGSTTLTNDRNLYVDSVGVRKIVEPSTNSTTSTTPSSGGASDSSSSPTTPSAQSTPSSSTATSSTQNCQPGQTRISNGQCVSSCPAGQQIVFSGGRAGCANVSPSRPRVQCYETFREKDDATSTNKFLYVGTTCEWQAPQTYCDLVSVSTPVGNPGNRTYYKTYRCPDIFE